MKSFVVLTRNNWVWVAALMLILVALVLPTRSWADHSSNHPDSQFDNPSSISSSEAYAALVEKYKTGELEYHAPGRRDERSSTASINPGLTDAALLAAYPEVMAYRRSVSAEQEGAAASSINLGLTNAALLAAYPEIKAYRRSVAGQQMGAAASSARWVALGAYYTDRGATFLAANPEITAFRRYVAKQDCSEIGFQC